MGSPILDAAAGSSVTVPGRRVDADGQLGALPTTWPEGDARNEPSAQVRRFWTRILSSDPWIRDGFAIADGLPTEEEQARRAVEACSRAIGPLLPQDSNGALVREVRYRGVSLGEGATGRYSDSRDGGQLHTDGPHRPNEPPRMFALLCVRQAHVGGSLLLVNTARVVAALQPASVAVLSGDFRFDRREPDTVPITRPVLRRNESGAWELTYLREYIELGHKHPGAEPLTGPQLDALDDLDDIVSRLTARPDGHTEVKLRPGQMILVDNRRLLHGRTAFGESPDDLDRLMLRTWIGAAG